MGWCECLINLALRWPRIKHELNNPQHNEGKENGIWMGEREGPEKVDGLTQVPTADYPFLTTPRTLSKNAMVFVPKKEEDRLRQGESI